MSFRSGFLAAVLVLCAMNLSGIWVPGWLYLPLNLAGVVVLLVIARRAGATRNDLGLQPGAIRSGLRFGLAVSIPAAIVIVVAALIPATRGLFADTRAGGIGGAGLLYQALIRIPLGTALFEEVAFRGVLVGLGRKGWSHRAGTRLAAVLFGLWHIVPAVSLSTANATAESVPLAIVIFAAAGSTAAVGLVFTWLRDRANSLVAPIVVHAVVNAISLTMAWVLL